MEKAGQAFTDDGKVGKQFTEDGKVGAPCLLSPPYNNSVLIAPVIVLPALPLLLNCLAKLVLLSSLHLAADCSLRRGI